LIVDPIEPFRKEVESKVKEALESMGVEVQFEIETPPADIADFAVPCFPLAKILKRSPIDIADELASKLGDMELFTRVWNERGYLNFKANDDLLTGTTLEQILRARENYGKGKGSDESILLEHTSVNPTGPIHIGRARNPLIGDTLARCLRFYGHEVITEYYVNDVGKQVVLLTWGLENLTEDQVEIPDSEKEDHRLVGYYRKANQLMESDPRVGEEIQEMLRRFEEGDEEIIDRVRRTAKRMLKGIIISLEKVGVEIDSFAWESQFIVDGTAREVVDRLKSSGYAMEEDGAYYLDLESFGVHGHDTRWFFTRNDGTTLYTTRDLAYHLNKFSRADHLINVLGEDQKLGMQQLASALTILGEETKPENVFYSFVSLPEGKMSTRRGTVVNLDDLIEEAEERALEEVKKRRTDLSEGRMEEISKAIGSGAIRYNILRVQSEKQMIFRWEEALNFEGNSAPFLQYSHARACSILRKAGEYATELDPSLLSDPYEMRLIRVLARFPSVMEEAAEKRRIHLLPSYGQEVASAFNQFYAYVPVLRSGENRGARLSLVEATMWVLKNTLNTLGIVAPEEM
jgi:arginyl-tRNA synthetase